MPRGRLRSALDGGADWRVALVRSRAGSGKTTALHDWATGIDAAVAFLELDAAHDDPRRFVAALSAALGAPDPALAGGVSGSSSDDADAHEVVEALLAQVEPDLSMVVIDSVERMQDEWVLDAVTRAERS